MGKSCFIAACTLSTQNRPTVSSPAAVLVALNLRPPPPPPPPLLKLPLPSSLVCAAFFLFKEAVAASRAALCNFLLRSMHTLLFRWCLCEPGLKNPMLHSGQRTNCASIEVREHARWPPNITNDEVTAVTTLCTHLSFLDQAFKHLTQAQEHVHAQLSVLIRHVNVNFFVVSSVRDVPLRRGALDGVYRGCERAHRRRMSSTRKMSRGVVSVVCAVSALASDIEVCTCVPAASYFVIVPNPRLALLSAK